MRFFLFIFGYTHSRLGLLEVSGSIQKEISNLKIREAEVNKQLDGSRETHFHTHRYTYIVKWWLCITIEALILR